MGYFHWNIVDFLAKIICLNPRSSSLIYYWRTKLFICRYALGILTLLSPWIYDRHRCGTEQKCIGSSSWKLQPSGWFPCTNRWKLWNTTKEIQTWRITRQLRLTSHRCAYVWGWVCEIWVKLTSYIHPLCFLLLSKSTAWNSVNCWLQSTKWSFVSFRGEFWSVKLIERQDF